MFVKLRYSWTFAYIKPNVVFYSLNAGVVETRVIRLRSYISFILKRILAIYVPRMRNNNLKIMNAGSSSRPQLHCGQSLAFLLKQIYALCKTR